MNHSVVYHRVVTGSMEHVHRPKTHLIKEDIMKKQFIIDRFEGNFVIVEYGDITFSLPREIFPSDAKEGQVIDISIRVNHNETEELRKQVISLSRKLFRDE